MKGELMTKNILLMVLLVILTLSTFSNEIVRREINIQCPGIEFYEDNPILEKINTALYDYSLKTYYDETPEADQFDLSEWSVEQYLSDYEIKLYNDHYLSVFFKQYYYPYRAAHGHGFKFGVVFDMTTGEEIEMDELLKTLPNYRDRITTYLKNHYGLIKTNDKYRIEDVELKTLKEDSFYLTEHSLVLLYQTWLAGSYTAEYEIPLSQLDFKMPK